MSLRVEAPAVGVGTVLTPTPTPTRPRETVSWRRYGAGLLRLARPRQWTKNILVLVAPGAAGILGNVHPLLVAVGAVAVFCIASSGTYAINDALDAEADRQHPTKCTRPVAADLVTVRNAVTFGVACFATALGLAFLTAGTSFSIIMATYIGLTCTYTLRPKRVPVMEMICVSGGVVLRAIGGGVATGVAISNWFVIVASFGALFIVAGKRSAEHRCLGDERSAHRTSLASYSLSFLQLIRLFSASVTVIAYGLWAYDRSTHLSPGHIAIWCDLSLLPVLMAIILVEREFKRGNGASPEELGLTNRALQLTALTWVALFALSVYS